MRRRDFAVGVAANALAWPSIARAQPSATPHRIGLLSNDAHSSANATAFWGTIRQELQRLGWAEGKSLAYELASSDGHFERLPAVARDLVGRNVDLIVVAGGYATLAVRDATKAIPVVFVAVSDPVGSGLVKSLARPGGNITGLANLSTELIAKRLQLLMDVAKGGRRVAYLTYETGATSFDEEAARAGAALGLQWQQIKVGRQQDLADTIAGAGDADAWLVGDPVLVFPRDLVVRLLAAHRKPVVYPNSTFVRVGGLMSYGADTFALARRAARYVDRILRGGKPAELPIEQPANFQLAVNLETARALGIELPPSLLARADEVIE